MKPTINGIDEILREEVNIRSDSWYQQNEDEVDHLPMPIWSRALSRSTDAGWSNTKYYYLECQFGGLQQLANVVTCDPSVKGGVPVLRGTRFTASQVVAEIAESDAVVEVCENLSLSKEDVNGLLTGISMLLMQPRTK